MGAEILSYLSRECQDPLVILQRFFARSDYSGCFSQVVDGWAGHGVSVICSEQYEVQGHLVPCEQQCREVQREKNPAGSVEATAIDPNTVSTTSCGSTKRPTFTSANGQQQVLGSLACPYRFECLFPLCQRKASAHQWSGFYLALS